MAGFDITDSFRFVGEAFYTNRRGEAQLAAQPLSPLTISAQNVYNPFGVNITGAGFRPIAFPRKCGQDQDTWRFYGGLQGEFEIGDRAFNWGAGYNFAENKQLQIKENFYFSTRVANATGPSFIESGVALCGIPDNPPPGRRAQRDRWLRPIERLRRHGRPDASNVQLHHGDVAQLLHQPPGVLHGEPVR